jgi:Carboxypeptidase regulatory-like domain/TonB-dependent Receptor Plug Domain
MSFGFRSFAVRLLAVSAMLMLFVVAAHAQGTLYGAVNGVVTDPQNKAIAGASVTARNTATNVVSKPIMTDTDGKYIISFLQPGPYEISVDATGFANLKRPSVTVELGRSTNVDLQVSLAGQAEKIDITAQAPVINTEANDVSTNYDKTAMANLPISIRRWSYLVLSSPGTVPDGTFGDVSFRGISGLLNNNTVDGADNNQAFFSEEKGRTRINYSLSMNSVQEFQVNTSNYSAEYGRSAGGVINAVTKSGTNTIHGSLFYYDRDAAWGGFAPFNTGATQTSPGVFVTAPLKPKDIRSQFGGDAGGWLIKNKLFWYFNGDGVIRAFPGVAIPNGPATFFQSFTSDPTKPGPNNISAPTGTNPDGSPTSCISPQVFTGTNANPKWSPFLGTFSANLSVSTAQINTLTIGQQFFCRGITAAMANDAVGFLTSMTGQVKRTGDQSIYFPKMDWHVNENNTITVSYNRLRWNSPFGIQTATNVSRGTDSFGNDYVKGDTAIARWTSNWGSAITNEFRFVWGRDFEFENTTPPVKGEPVATATGFSPGVTIGGYSAGNTAGVSFTFGVPNFLNRGALPNETKYQLANTLAFNKGKHFIKVGFDTYRSGDRISNLFEQFGIYSYSNMADYITDYEKLKNGLGFGCQSASTYTQPQFINNNPNPPTITTPAVLVTANIPCYSSFAQGFGPAGFNFRTWDASVFFQDDYHVSRRVTLNFGLRYEHEFMPVNPIPNATFPASGYMPHDNKDFGPRAGFAWDIFGTGKTVLRGGAGIYYGRIINDQIYGAISQDGSLAGQLVQTVFPTTGSTNSSGGLTPGAPSYPQINTSFNPVAGQPSIVYFAGNARLPQIDQFDMVVEHEIAPNTVVSLSYLGAYGRFLPMGIDTNAPPQNGNIVYTIGGTVPALNNASILAQLPAVGSTFTVPFYPGGTASRPNKNFQTMAELSTSAKSWYNAGVIQLTRRMTHGLQVQTSYQWAHAIDTDQFSSAIISSSTPLSPNNIAQDRGNSVFDVRQRFLAAIVYQPQFFANSDHKIAHWVLYGWTIAPVQTISTGLPFSGGVSGSGPGTTLGVIGANGSGRVPFLGRDTFRFPNILNTDIKVARSFHVWERVQLEVSAEVFNLCNNLNVTGLNTTLFSAGAGNNPNLTTGTPATQTLTYQSSFNSLTAASNSVFLSQRLFQIGANIKF